MKIINLTKNNSTYTSNAYYLRGEWNTLSDINTIIDTGRDSVFFDEIEKIYTGVGKTRIESVLITHNHYDHTGNLKEIIKRWRPKVFAMSKSIDGVTHVIKSEDVIKVGDTEAIAVFCPGHSSDSVCYYIPTEKALFSGDTNLINLSDADFQPEFLKCLEKINCFDIQVIYPGHGDPITIDCNRRIRDSLIKIRKHNSISLMSNRDNRPINNYSWYNLKAIKETVKTACNNFYQIFTNVIGCIVIDSNRSLKGIANENKNCIS